VNKEKSLQNLIVVGDRVLIRPKSLSNKTKTGLFLPPGYSEREDIQSGYVVKVGPGYPIPYPQDEDSEPWKTTAESEKVRYIPLQPREGDMAIYLAKGAIEIAYDGEKYFVVPQHSILLLERDESLFE
jgi:co-chaperonin GroES (HSP10)